MHYTVDGDNRVSYFVEDVEGRFESYEKAEAAGDVSGVELSYFCPWCDAPNAIAYSTPVPEGLTTSCSECDRTQTIFRTSSGDDSFNHYSADDFEDVADKLETKRNARRLGEACGRERYKIRNRRRLISNLMIVGGILGGGFVIYQLLLFGLSVGIFPIIVYGVTLLLFAGLLVGLTLAHRKLVHPILEPYRERFGIQRWEVSRYSSYVREGVRMSDGTSRINKYEPDAQNTSEESEVDDIEKELDRN